MGMWLRLGGAMAVTVALMLILDQLRPGAHSGGAAMRLRGLFWLAIFAVVMVMSVVAAARRQAAKLRRAER